MASHLARSDYKLNLRYATCKVCNRRGDKFKKSHFQSVTANYVQRLNQSNYFDFEFQIGDFLCFDCRKNFQLGDSRKFGKSKPSDAGSDLSSQPTFATSNSTEDKKQPKSVSVEQNFLRNSNQKKNDSGKLGFKPKTVPRATVLPPQSNSSLPTLVVRRSNRATRKPAKFSNNQSSVKNATTTFKSPISLACLGEDSNTCNQSRLLSKGVYLYSIIANLFNFYQLVHILHVKMYVMHRWRISKMFVMIYNLNPSFLQL